MANFKIYKTSFGATIQKDDGATHSNEYGSESFDIHYGNLCIKVDNAFFTIQPTDAVYIDGVLFVGTIQELKAKLEEEVFKAGSSASTTEGGAGVQDITYSGLMAQMGAGGLTAGQQYRITDFQTRHYIVDGDGNQYPDSIITGEVEPLLVTAIAGDKISSEAKSALYPQDIIHYDPIPANWLKDYSFADHSGEPTIIPGFKGVIYSRHDTLLDNCLGYDFRNVKFRRWKVDANDTTPTAITPGGLTLFVDVKTFAEDLGGSYQRCRNNYFAPTKDNYDIWFGIPSILPNSVFWLQGGGLLVSGNRVGVFFLNNTIGSQFNFNTIGNNFKNNIVGNGFQMNMGQCEWVDFSGATHVYYPYNCHLQQSNSGMPKLTYLEQNTQIVVDANA